MIKLEQGEGRQQIGVVTIQERFESFSSSHSGDGLLKLQIHDVVCWKLMNNVVEDEAVPHLVSLRVYQLIILYFSLPPSFLF